MSPLSDESKLDRSSGKRNLILKLTHVLESHAREGTGRIAKTVIENRLDNLFLH